MSNITLARPYAKAIFELALVDNTFDAWQQSLHTISAVVENKEVVDLIQNPQLSSSQAVQLLIELCGKGLSDKGQNLIQLLAENHRLLLLAEIVELYAEYVAEHQRQANVHVISAKVLNDAQQNVLIEALKKHLQQDVALTHDVDNSLLGGAVIHVGDRVIDGSLRNRLNRLQTSIQG